VSKLIEKEKRITRELLREGEEQNFRSYIDWWAVLGTTIKPTHLITMSSNPWDPPSRTRRTSSKESSYLYI
jgi:hypothetical protein